MSKILLFTSTFQIYLYIYSYLNAINIENKSISYMLIMKKLTNLKVERKKKETISETQLCAMKIKQN